MTVSTHRPEERELLQRQALEWITKMSLEGASERDIAALQEWRGRSAAHAEAFSAAARTWRSLDPVLESARREGKAGFMAAERLQRTTPGRRAVIGGLVGAATAAVAGVTVVRPPLGLWPSLFELTADYRTGIGQQRKVSVGQTASIELNTGTSISLRPQANGQSSIELISGEAVITKTASATTAFIVIAGEGRATAREAIFNIRRDGAVVCVTCISGTVQVGQDWRQLPLGAGQQVSYSDTTLGAPMAVDSEVVAAWRDGMLVFHDRPLAQVIDEVNRYRPGRILLLNAALGRRLVTARFELGQLDDVIVQMNQVFGARVTELPGGLVLLS
jgi:transmembrane sensor